MLIGHEQLVEDFKRLAERKELSHGYIFSGPARVGKKLFALCFANFLETGDFDSPSQVLPGKILEGKEGSEAKALLPPKQKILRDAFLLEPDENKTIGIDEIRRIRNFLWQKPIASRKRTVIINDAEALTGEAQNAFLKIAEEPPESALLILVVRDSEKLWPTLRSRLQKIYFSSVPPPLIKNWLEEKFHGDRQQFQSAVKLSSGQPGLAWKMLFDERFRALQKSGENFLKSGFWERREIIKTLLEKDDFNLSEFLEVLLMLLSFDKLPFEGLSQAPQGQSNGRMVSRVEPSQKETPATTNSKLWHRILDLRRNADYLNLNPRLQLENLLNGE